jgi:hypothetical protein
MEMNKKQKIAVISPLVLIGVMVPIFRFLAHQFGETMGWYLGLGVYWIVWGAFFPIIMLGKERLGKIIRPRKISLKSFCLSRFQWSCLHYTGL